jgi:hypothetical protein
MACARIALIVIVSDWFALLSVEKVTVIVEAATAIDAAVISLEEVYDTDPEPVLNLQFVGAVKIKVLLVCLADISVLDHSAITILPKAV